MIQIDTEMPKKCIECPMNSAGWICGCMYYMYKDADWTIKRIIEEQYRIPDDGRPKWCPIKEVEDVHT